MGVVNEMVNILAAGNPVKGTIELPDSLVYWQLGWENDSLALKVVGHVDLDEPIELAIEETQPDDFPG